MQENKEENKEEAQEKSAEESQALKPHLKPQEKKRPAGFGIARARVGTRPWLPLDNASKIFLATTTSVDTKVFRLTAGLAEDVRPELLQQALDKAYESFPLYHATLRRGFFWYFAEHAELRPEAEKEEEIPCAQIYRSKYRGLLFRVLYRANRIHLEVFHALSDGNGAVAFFQLLLIHYLNLCREADKRPASGVVPYFVAAQSKADSFTEYFSDVKHEDFEASSLVQGTSSEDKSKAPVYRIKGEQTADGRMNILEIHLRTSDALAAARAAGATLTGYFCAVYMLAIARTMPEKKKKRRRRIVLSVPVDLRQYFPSLSLRNFFATVMLDYTFVPGKRPAVPELAKSLTQQLKEKSSKEKIRARAANFVRLEKTLAIRLVPLVLKDAILRFANFINNFGITAAMTNLGRFRLPPDLTTDLEEMNVMTSAVRPQFSMVSFEKDLSVVFTSPKKSRAIERMFCRILAEEGLDLHFAVEATPPLTPEEARQTEGAAKAAEKKNEPEHAAALRRRLHAGPGKILVRKDRRRSSKDCPYPYVPLSLNLKLADRLLAGLCVLIIIVAFLGKHLGHWDFPVTLPMLACATAWVMVRGILRNRRNLARTVLQQSIFISITVCLIDLLIGWQGWSLSIALPIINACALAAGHIALLVSRRALEEGLLFMLTIAVLGLVPLIFSLSGLADPAWPGITAAVFSGLSFLMTAVLRRKLLKEEWGRNWHL